MKIDIIKWSDENHDILLLPSSDVDFDASIDINGLVQNLFETMYANKGLGLAAPQVGIRKKIFVVNCSPQKTKEHEFIFINPVILETNGEQIGDEGCLSFPLVFIRRVRPKSVYIEAQRVDGSKFRMRAEGLLARCILHEKEHLEGVLLNSEGKYVIKP